jgi:transposase
MTSTCHTHEHLVGLLGEVLASQPKGRVTQVVCNNFSCHKTALAQAFLAELHKVRIHYPPTYPPRLNQIESCFSSIKKEQISLKVFTSVKDSNKKRTRDTRKCN